MDFNFIFIFMFKRRAKFKGIFYYKYSGINNLKLINYYIFIGLLKNQADLTFDVTHAHNL